jgi:hypothetical protein
MSIYTCKLCDQQKDCDFDGCYEYMDGLICEDCEAEVNPLPEIKPIPKITRRPIQPSQALIDALGDVLEPYCKEGEQISDDEKEAMEKRFWDSMELVVDNRGVDYD